MDFNTSVKTCFNKYLTIDGRAARPEYWWFALFYVICLIVASIIDAIIGYPIFYFVTSLALLAPAITVGVRRLHDKDRTGWWLLLGLIPVVGTIILLYWFVTRGTEGENRFGPYPVS